MAGTHGKATAPRIWPQLPCGIKNGVSGQAGAMAYVGLGTAGTALYKLDLTDSSAGWIECAPFPGAPTEGAAAAIAAGRLFVFSGAGKEHPDAATPVVLDDVYAYDLANDSWQKVPTQPPVGLLGASAVALDDDRIAIFGGYNRDVFNSFVRESETIDKVNEPDRWHAFLDAFMSREIVDFRWNASVLIYSITPNNWSVAGTNPYPPNAGAALVADANGFTLIGGEVKPGLRTNRVQHIRFQSGTAIWSQRPQLPPHASDLPSEGLAGAYAGYIGQTLVVAGGTFFPGARAAYEAGRLYAHQGLTKTWRDEIFALQDGAWHHIGSLPLGLAYGACFAIDGGLLIAGGEDDQGRSCTTVHEITWAKDLGPTSA